MPVPAKYLADFEEGEKYHVDNRTNNKEKLFATDENRFFFLKRYKEIVAPFAHTYCWNLLPNHFHLMIKIKSEKEIINYLASKPKEALTTTEKRFLSSRVANLLKVGNPGNLLRYANPTKILAHQKMSSYFLITSKGSE